MKKFEKDFLDYLESAWADMGLDTLSSKLLAILFVEPDEVSIEALSERTGYSLASVSNKMRFMEGLGLCQRIKKPGTKRVYYYVESDILSVWAKKMSMLYQNQIIPAKEKIPKILSEAEKNLSDKEKAKVELIAKYYQQALKAEKLIKLISEEIKK